MRLLDSGVECAEPRGPVPAAGGGVAGGRGARPLPPRDRRAGAARHAGGRSHLRHQGQLLLAACHEEHSQADMSAMFHPALAYSHLKFKF